MIKFKSIKENQIGKRGKALNLAQDFKAGQTLAHLIYTSGLAAARR